MKIPLIYPKIPSPQNCPLKQCIAFEKLDGTNIHWKYTPNVGWTHFGTRRTEFTLDSDGVSDFRNTHPELVDAPDIFLKSFTWIVNNPPQEIILFTEFLGANSFAGTHLLNEQHKLVLFDALSGGKIMNPSDFLNAFCTFNPPELYEDGFDLPKIVYKGKYTGQFVEDVRNGKYNVNEGVVVKGVVNGEVYMTKIKTNAYMEKLKNKFEDKWKDYWE